MAKLNSKRFKCLAKLIEPNSGLSIAIRSDKIILRRVNDRWIRWRKLKPEVDPKEFIDKLLSKGWIEGQAPSLKTVERWIIEEKAEATDSCQVEPDGICPHGYKSWLLIYGLI